MLSDPFSLLPDSAKAMTQLQKGQYLFRQSEAVQAIFVLISGRVQMRKNTEDGQVVIIHQAVEQQSFAEAALFSEYYHCDCVSLADSTIMKVSKAAVLQAMTSDASFSNALVKMLSHQVQHSRQRLQISAIRSAKQRVLAAFTIQIPYKTITELADSVGLSHEACYRALSSLVTEGKLKKLARGHYALKR